MSISSQYRFCTQAMIILGGLTLTTTVVFGQSATSAEAEVDRYRHDPNTETAPLGKLGHLERRGNGPVHLVLLPGAGFDWTTWESFMDANTDRFRMVAITPPGYAGTPPPPMPDAFDRFDDLVWTNALLDAIVEVIRTEQLDRPLIVGHHLMGTYYALRLALDHPDLVGGAVTLGSTPVRALPGATASGGEEALTERARIVHKHPTQGPFYRTVSRETWLANTYQANQFCRDEERGQEIYDLQVSNPMPTQLRYFLEYLTDDPTLRMDELKVPVLAIDLARPLPRLESGVVDLEAYLSGGKARATGPDGKPIELDQVRSVVLQQYGTMEAFTKQLEKQAQPWSGIASEHALITLANVEDSRIFFMEDQPQRISDLIFGFAAGIE